MTDEEFEQLKMQVEEAAEACYTSSRTYREKKAERERHYAEIVAEECQSEKEALRVADRHYDELVDRLKTERDRRNLEAALADPNHLPPGTKIDIYSRTYWASAALHYTGKGVIEIWTEESLRSGRLPSYRVPSVGSRVVRKLKKDGKPSTDFIPFGGHREDSETLPYGCYLEGEKPKNAR